MENKVKHQKPIELENSINDELILKSLFDHLPVSIYIIDTEYNILNINNNRIQRTHNSTSKFIGKKCYKVFFNRDLPCDGCKADKTFISCHADKRFYTEGINHRNIDWEVNYYPVKNGHRTAQRVIVVEKDITHEKELEDNLIQTEKLAAVGHLAAGIAHEINNPLSAIIANAQLIQLESEINEDVLESAKLVELAGKKASQVIRNLLDLSRKEPIELRKFNINDTINGAINLLHHELILHKIDFALDLKSDLPLADISPDHLQGVWINLIINALDAIEKDNGKISLSSNYTKGKFIITVSDNGSGMTPTQIKNAFDPFFTTKSPGKGTGLGLSICHRIIKQHGGNINIVSELGKGTKITVKIPNIQKH